MYANSIISTKQKWYTVWKKTLANGVIADLGNFSLATGNVSTLQRLMKIYM